MNIPDNYVKEYPKENAIVIGDPRVFKGILTTAKVWGEECLSDPSAANTELLEEYMTEFAAKIRDLRAKYEVTGESLNGKASLAEKYYGELNLLLTKYRTLLFGAAMDYVSDDVAIDLIVELVQDSDKK
jgi:hypothetical protein